MNQAFPIECSYAACTVKQSVLGYVWHASSDCSQIGRGVGCGKLLIIRTHIVACHNARHLWHGFSLGECFDAPLSRQGLLLVYLPRCYDVMLLLRDGDIGNARLDFLTLRVLRPLLLRLSRFCIDEVAIFHLVKGVVDLPRWLARCPILEVDCWR